MSTSHAISRSRSRWSSRSSGLAATLLTALCIVASGCGERDPAAQVDMRTPSSAAVATVAAVDDFRTHAPAADSPASVEMSSTPKRVQPVRSAEQVAPVVVSHPLLERVVLIGASLTQGFGATLPIEGVGAPDAPPIFVPIALGDALVASINGDFRPEVAQGDMFFFMRPDRAGERLAKMAAQRDPSLLVALDFLFWFGYGELAPGETRAARIERGVALLEPFRCPIVVADFPDLSEAVGRMISPAQMPSPEELTLLNDAVRTWAAARGNVAILPLSQMLDTLRSGNPVSVAGAEWVPDERMPLLQEDRMHATPVGMLVVIRQLLAEIVGLEPAIGSVASVAVDPDRALQRLRALATERIAPPIAGP